MTRRTAFALACAYLLSVAVAPAAHAQEPGPQATITTRTTLVLVPALVRTKGGELVFTLKADDFLLTDDGIPQKLTLEEDTDSEPLALVVVIENGGSGAHELEKYKGLAPMLDAVIGQVPHRVAVVSFDSEPAVAQDFTPDLDQIGVTLNNLAPGDPGGAILDALGFSVDLLRKQPSQYRRAILLLSESNDHGSHIQLDDALRAISDTNTAIYSIGFSSSKADIRREGGKFNDATPGPPGGCMAKDPAADPATTQNKAAQAFDCLSELAPPLRLAKMAYLAARNSLRQNVPESVANLTGGEYFKLGDAKSLERTLQTISNHMPNRYVLSFHPQTPHPGLHALKLQLPDHANLDVTSRDTYWAEDASSTPRP